MRYTLSLSTRMIVAGLLLLVLAFQLSFSSALLAGHVYAHNGRITLANQVWKDSSWYYERANEYFPYDHHWLYGQATSHLNLGEIGAAIDALDQTLKHAPYYGAGLTSTGHQMVKSGNPAVAKSMIERGMALAPEFWSYHYLAALVALSEGDRAAGLESLKIANHNSMTVTPQVQRTTAQLNFVMQDLKSAQYAVNKGLRYAPTMPELWQLRGQIYHSGGDLDEGITSYNRALNLYQIRMQNSSTTAAKDAHLWGETSAYAGVAFAELKNDDKALAHFGDAAAQYIEIGAFTGTIAQMHERVGSSLAQTTPLAQLTWANVMVSAGLFQPAIVIFTRVDDQDAEAFPDLSRYYFGKALSQLGNHDAALTQFRKIKVLTWNHALAYADTLRAAGQPAAANFEYNRILTGITMNAQQRKVINERIKGMTQ